MAVSLGLHSASAKSVDPYGNQRRTPEGVRTQRSKDWVQGWWEHIAPQPIYIRDKYELKAACQKWSKITGREFIPKAFMKPKSQGKGFEWSF